MNKNRFDSLTAASSECARDYGIGYRCGLSSLFKGDASETKHDRNRQRAGGYGEGYRDGFAGKSPRVVHGSTGNSNASKANTMDATMTLRLPSELKGLCNARAQAEGLKLAQWVLKAMENALKEES